MNGHISFCILAASIGLACCQIVNLPPQNLEILYSWPIPSQEPIQSAQNQPPSTNCRHHVFNLRQSLDQLTRPNEFLITPRDPQKPSPPVFLELNPQQQQPCNCNDATSSDPARNCIQQHCTTSRPYNYFPAPGPTTISGQLPTSILPPNWPYGHAGGVGLLIAVPESASHLPGEQLILQALGINNHRMQQLPIDISANCGNNAADGNGCFSSSPAKAGVKLPTTRTNYASAPLMVNVNNSAGRQRRTVVEMLGYGGNIEKEEQEQ